MPSTFLWHDYETWGANPRADRPASFAGIRTDEDLNPIGEPLHLFCRPSDDVLPSPTACLVTGLTPQQVASRGMPEPVFMAAIHEALSEPGTCGVGYNSIGFDDEVTRFGLYRNFFTPYDREWRNGNSRFDLLDVMRMAHAFRPEGITWPTREKDGATSFKLEHLTAANGIAHAGAHDALVDVQATVELARRLKKAQPRLWSYALTLRNKKKVGDLLHPGKQQAVVWVSGRIPAARGCFAPVLPLSYGRGRTEVIVWDLTADPAALEGLTPEQVRQRVFTRQKDLPEGVRRLPLYTIRTNKLPMVSPMGILTPEVRERWSVDVDACLKNREAILRMAGVRDLVKEAMTADFDGPENTNPDTMLYDGFLKDRDAGRFPAIRQMDGEQLAQTRPTFEDDRLNGLMLRYRARNWPGTLSAEEQATWEAEREALLTAKEAGGARTISEVRAELGQLRESGELKPGQEEILAAVEEWVDGLL